MNNETGILQILGIPINKGTGTPYDRGASDYHYWRDREPHFYPSGTLMGGAKRKAKYEMTGQQIAEYNAGYDAELSRKDWT